MVPGDPPGSAGSQGDGAGRGKGQTAWVGRLKARSRKHYTITLENRGGETLGICADQGDEKTLQVVSISAGLIQQWNTEHPNLEVQQGDRIVDVNGVRGSSQDLVEECQKVQCLQMRLRRPRSNVAQAERQANGQNGDAVQGEEDDDEGLENQQAQGDGECSSSSGQSGNEGGDPAPISDAMPEEASPPSQLMLTNDMQQASMQQGTEVSDQLMLTNDVVPPQESEDLHLASPQTYVRTRSPSPEPSAACPGQLVLWHMGEANGQMTQPSYGRTSPAPEANVGGGQMVLANPPGSCQPQWPMSGTADNQNQSGWSSTLTADKSGGIPHTPGPVPNAEGNQGNRRKGNSKGKGGRGKGGKDGKDGKAYAAQESDEPGLEQNHGVVGPPLPVTPLQNYHSDQKRGNQKGPSRGRGPGRGKACGGRKGGDEPFAWAPAQQQQQHGMSQDPYQDLGCADGPPLHPPRNVPRMRGPHHPPPSGLAVGAVGHNPGRTPVWHPQDPPGARLPPHMQDGSGLLLTCQRELAHGPVSMGHLDYPEKWEGRADGMMGDYEARFGHRDEPNTQDCQRPPTRGLVLTMAPALRGQGMPGGDQRLGMADGPFSNDLGGNHIQPYQHPQQEQQGEGWFYLDTVGNEFGPAPTHLMREMFQSGYFANGRDLLVRMANWTTLIPVSDLYPHGEPFDGPPFSSGTRLRARGHWGSMPEQGHPQADSWGPKGTAGGGPGLFDAGSNQQHPSAPQFPPGGGKKGGWWDQGGGFSSCGPGGHMQQHDAGRQPASLPSWESTLPPGPPVPIWDNCGNGNLGPKGNGKGRGGNKAKQRWPQQGQQQQQQQQQHEQHQQMQRNQVEHFRLDSADNQLPDCQSCPQQQQRHQMLMSQNLQQHRRQQQTHQQQLLSDEQMMLQPHQESQRWQQDDEQQQPSRPQWQQPPRQHQNRQQQQQWQQQPQQLQLQQHPHNENAHRLPPDMRRPRQGAKWTSGGPQWDCSDNLVADRSRQPQAGLQYAPD